QATGSYGPQGGAYQYIYSCLTSVPAGSTEQTCTAATAEPSTTLGFAPAGSGLSRVASAAAGNPDTRTSGGVTTYLLGGSNYRINRRYSVQNNNATLCATNGNVAITGAAAWAQPTPSTDWDLVGKDQPYIEILRYT